MWQLSSKVPCQNQIHPEFNSYRYCGSTNFFIQYKYLPSYRNKNRKQSKAESCQIQASIQTTELLAWERKWSMKWHLVKEAFSVQVPLFPLNQNLTILYRPLNSNYTPIPILFLLLYSLYFTFYSENSHFYFKPHLILILHHQSIQFYFYTSCWPK